MEVIGILLVVLTALKTPSQSTAFIFHWAYFGQKKQSPCKVFSEVCGFSRETGTVHLGSDLAVVSTTNKIPFILIVMGL